MGRYHGGTILPSPLGLIIYFGTFGRKVMVMLRYIIDPEMTIGVTICNIHICFEKRNKNEKKSEQIKMKCVVRFLDCNDFKKFQSKNNTYPKYTRLLFIERTQYFVGFYARSSKM